MADAILKQMILDAPIQVSDIEKSLTSINSSISDFQGKLNSLQRVCNTVTTNLETHLNSKFPPSDYYMYKGPNYNQSTSQLGDFSDWKIFKDSELTGLVFEGPDSFSCDGDQTSIFSEGADISIICGSSRVIGSVKESTFSGTTTVVLNEEVLTDEIDSVWSVEYSYIPGDDSTIDNQKTDWDFSHDYITSPLSTGGTYGILDNITKLNSAKDLLTANKDKLSSSVSRLAQYI